MTTQAATAAEQMSEGARDLCHATMAGKDDLEYPSDVDRVIADLEIMAQRLPQALEQLADWLESEQQAGRVGDDRPGTDERVTVGLVRAALESAYHGAADLEVNLRMAHSACAHLTGKE